MNSTADGREPAVGCSLTADGLVLVFTRDPVGETLWDAPRLYESRRASVDEPFGAAVRLEGGVERRSAFTPHLSPDGTLLLFSTAGLGSEDIWVCTRPDTDSPFGAPVDLNAFSLGSTVNTPAWESWPSLSRDWPAPGSKIYYAPSAAIGSWEEISDRVDADLWEAEWVPYQSPPTLWRQVTTDPANTPPGREKQAMVYDEQREVIVMHGGHNQSALLGETWEYDGESWTLVSTEGPALVFHAMAYDSKRQRIVLFGGAIDWGSQTGRWRGETWEYGLIPLRITAAQLQPDGALQIRWDGEAPPYQVQSRAAVDNGPWRNESERVTGQSATVEAEGDTTFFRVVSLYGD